MIKKMIITLLAATTIFSGSLLGQPKEIVYEYPETFIVDEVNQEENYIILKTFSGNLFRWNNTEDWDIGDIAAAIMNSNGTEEVEDDSIVMLQYSGWID